MNLHDKETLYHLFRYHINVIGAVRTTTMALRAFITAFENLHCNDSDTVLDLFVELSDVVRHSEPKIIPLIHLLEGVEAELRAAQESDEPVRLRASAIRILTERIARYETLTAAVIRQGLAHVNENDVIIVHSVSAVVTDILLQASSSLGRTFHVIVLEFDPVRTHQVVSILHNAGVSYSVLPEYSLCHHLEEADKFFMGALSLTRDRKVVAPIGSANVVGLCHAHGIRSYLFASTLHYAHGHAVSQLIHKTKTNRVHAQANYPMTRYSHDLVELSLIDNLVNENGTVSPRELNW